MKLAGLIVRAATCLLQHEVFFAYLRERALQIEDMLLLLVQLLGNGDLLFERNTLRVVGESNLVQLLDERGSLVECRVLPRQLHVEDRCILIKIESEEAASLHKYLLCIIELSDQRVKACKGLVPQDVQIVTLGLVAEQRTAILKYLGFLVELSRRVLQLCLQLEDIFAYL